MEKLKNALVRGHQVCIQLSKEVSQNCFLFDDFDVANVKNKNKSRRVLVLFLVLYPVRSSSSSSTRAVTHTCSEISYRITDVECITRAKNTSVILDKNGLMIRSEKLCEGKLSTSLMQLSQIAKTVQVKT